MADFSASDFATAGVATEAIQESVNSQLPGRNNGPADAYRHVLLSAELTRQFGETYARAALDFHEWDGNRTGQAADTNHMDEHNNELGIALGKRLAAQPSSSWHDVVSGARALIDAAPKQAGGIQWLKEDRWQMNPMGPDGKRLTTGDARLNWPPQWPEGPFQSPQGRDTGEPYTEEEPVQSMDHMAPPRQPRKDFLDRLRENVESVLDERYGRLHTEAARSTLVAQSPAAVEPAGRDHHTYVMSSDTRQTKPANSPLADRETAPEHPLLTQARAAVQRLDASLGRTWDPASERMSASLACLARQNGLTGIDHVVLSGQGRESRPGENVFVVQGRLDDPAHLHAHMRTDVAVHTPMQDSMQRLQELDKQMTAEQALGPALQLEAQRRSMS
ncbi:XVIPCD domain-containing protein [Lysobacter sp. Root559]|uniref:XVIPCD domain-containing protein n=1 Tax=Lysobacter sp. Root559 TaxID=1736559 RepID=UPI0009E6E000|nr:XVIPCD domain-containing protein [Lysobacter sp. Root559]